MRTSELHFPDQAPFYKTYIDTLGDVELMDILQSQLINFPQFISSIPDDKLNFIYGENKWSLLQVLLHILDSERIFQYRALRFSRGDKTPLPGFDQDLFVLGSNVSGRTKESIIEEYQNVRGATISLFVNLETESLEKTGIASNLEWSVGKLGFVICGHQKHHRNIIRQRYL